MYFPLSQIKTNLFTNGGEFIRTDTQEEYKGYYFEVSKGTYFSGQTPNTPDSTRLIPITDESNLSSNNNIPFQTNLTAANFSTIDTGLSSIQYNELRNVSIYDSNPIQIPYYNATLPTFKDYSIGEFIRYFCKKTNEIIYIEIDRTQYNKLVNFDPKILFQLYQPFFLTWQITGDKQTVAKTNKNIVELKSKRERLPKLGDYLKHDYIKYYKE